MGTPAMAAAFKADADVHFTLLVDSKKETYRALEVKRGNLLEVAGPSVWLKGIKGVVTGKQSARPQQDPFQLGATAVIEPGGKVRHLHKSKNSADNFPVKELLKLL